MSALEKFEAEAAEILMLLAKIGPSIREYDREISSAPGGHRDYSHAGTLTNIRQQLQQAFEDLTSARAATRERTAKRLNQRKTLRERFDAFDRRGRLVRVSVPK